MPDSEVKDAVGRIARLSTIVGGVLPDFVEDAAEERPSTLATNPNRDEARRIFQEADDAWFEYQLDHPGTYVTKDGRVVRKERTEKKPPPDMDPALAHLWDGDAEEVEVEVPEGQKFWTTLQKAERDLERAETKYKDEKEAEKDKAKSYKDSEASARAYAEAERAAEKYEFEKSERKPNETERQLADFLSRADAYYDYQDQERDYAEEAQTLNRETQDWARDTGAPVGGETWFGSSMPGPRMSSMIYPTIPAEVTPDYRLNEEVGLPGGSGFNYPKLGDQIIGPRYAQGTDFSGVAPGNQDLEWMVGIPFFPRNPNAKAVPVPESWMKNRSPRMAQGASRAN
jgi:hypothetical protein